jgi:hypothetical protein
MSALLSTCIAAFLYTSTHFSAQTLSMFCGTAAEHVCLLVRASSMWVLGFRATANSLLHWHDRARSPRSFNPGLALASVSGHRASSCLGDLSSTSNRAEHRYCSVSIYLHTLLCSKSGHLGTTAEHMCACLCMPLQCGCLGFVLQLMLCCIGMTGPGDPGPSTQA